MNNENNDKQDLINYRLACAKEDLNSAIRCLEIGELRLANNRAYYSIFHSMRTVLALEQKDFKKHSAVIAYFNQNYIKTKIFPSNLFELIRNSNLIREESDYDDFYVASMEETKEQIESAKLIYGLVEQYIKQQETQNV